MYSKLKVGILALQGAVDEHQNSLLSLGILNKNIFLIKDGKDLSSIDALILPGGESTAMKNLLKTKSFQDNFNLYLNSKKPILGTCAGMILMAKEYLTNEAKGLNILDVEVERNAFGRQVNSCEALIDIKGFDTLYNAVFIRAPRILSIDKEKVEILAYFEDSIVFVKQDNYFAASFHPELTQDFRVHELFLNAAL
ncbi:MAG: pyridoxal 5'-phosphate synthase glutaminase subunit PdxT [Psittacicella sp.]